jgi:hypothetical protein
MDRQTDGKPAAGDKVKGAGKERVVCLGAADVKLLWEHAYDCPYTIAYRSGPRTTPLVHQGAFTPSGQWATSCAWTRSRAP